MICVNSVRWITYISNTLIIAIVHALTMGCSLSIYGNGLSILYSLYAYVCFDEYYALCDVNETLEIDPNYAYTLSLREHIYCNIAQYGTEIRLIISTTHWRLARVLNIKE